MPKIKVILFDLDGTLRDSGEMIWQSIEHALKQNGVSATREQIRPHIHHHEKVYEGLASHTSKEDFLKAYWEKVEELRPQMTVYEAGPKVVTQLHESGYRLGIVTTAHTAPQTLKKAKIDHLFDVIVGREDTKEHKPHPEPVLLAIKKLGCLPEEAVMVGDLSADIIASKAAGLASAIGITHGMGTLEDLRAAGADYIINRLEELPELLEIIQHGS